MVKLSIGAQKKARNKMSLTNEEKYELRELIKLHLKDGHSKAQTIKSLSNQFKKPTIAKYYDTFKGDTK